MGEDIPRTLSNALQLSAPTPVELISLDDVPYFDDAPQHHLSLRLSALSWPTYARAWMDRELGKYLSSEHDHDWGPHVSDWDPVAVINDLLDDYDEDVHDQEEQRAFELALTTPTLARIDALTLAAPIDDDAASALLASPHCPTLTRLEFENERSEIDVLGLTELANHPKMANLRELVFASFEISEDALLAIARGAAMARLERLDVSTLWGLSRDTIASLRAHSTLPEGAVIRTAHEALIID